LALTFPSPGAGSIHASSELSKSGSGLLLSSAVELVLLVYC